MVNDEVSIASNNPMCRPSYRNEIELSGELYDLKISVLKVWIKYSLRVLKLTSNSTEDLK